MTKKDTNENPFGDEFKEVQAGDFVKWETVGQTFKGTYKGSYETENSLTGTMQKIYDFTGEDGEEYRIGSRGEIFDRIMKTVSVGQKVAFFYAEDIPSKKKGNNPFKLIKIYKGEMDPNFEPTVESVDDIKFDE